VPHIHSGSSLTGLGVLLGIGVMAVFVLINLVAILILSAIGSQDFGGTNWIPAP